MLLDPAGRSLKAQMKQADKFQARFALIMGEDELQRGVAVLRDMASKEQEELRLGENLVQELAVRLNHQ